MAACRDPEILGVAALFDQEILEARFLLALSVPGAANHPGPGPREERIVSRVVDPGKPEAPRLAPVPEEGVAVLHSEPVEVGPERVVAHDREADRKGSLVVLPLVLVGDVG